MSIYCSLDFSSKVAASASGCCWKLVNEALGRAKESALILADRLTGPMAMDEISDDGLITAFVCTSEMYRKLRA